MGASLSPESTQELLASFMYAAGQGSEMAITAALGHMPEMFRHVMASLPSALPGHSNWNPGAAWASR
jgi:hypothetical protein